MHDRLKVRAIAFGGYHPDGRFYPTIDGEAWGEGGRSFWPTRAEATRVGMRCLTKLIELEARDHSARRLTNQEQDR